MRLTHPAVAVLAAAAVGLPLLATSPAPVGAAVPTGVTVRLDETSTPLTARRGRASRAEAGSVFVLRGKVTTRRGVKRAVTLREKTGRRLRTLDRARVSRKGRFSFGVRAGNRLGLRTFVVTAPRAGGLKPFRETRKVRVVSRTGTPTPTPPPVAPVPGPVPVPGPTPVPTPTPTVPPAPAPLTPTTVGAAWDRPRVAAYSSATVASGTVTGAPAGRYVQVQGQFGNDWITLARGTTGADGTFAVPLPADFLRSSPTRVYVEATATATEAVTPATATEVVPDYTPSGTNPNDWTPLSTSLRLRYDACAPVRYRVNYTHAPAYARDLVERAIREAHFATGLTFVDGGDTGAHAFPADGLPGIDASTTDLLISFGGQAHTSASAEYLGWGGGARTYYATDAAGQHGQIDTAQVFINSVNPPPDWVWSAERMYGTISHEIAHALGLGHSAGEDQAMYYKNLPSRPVRYGLGDLTGLRSVGLQHGCSRLVLRDGGTNRVLEGPVLP